MADAGEVGVVLPGREALGHGLLARRVVALGEAGSCGLWRPCRMLTAQAPSSVWRPVMKSPECPPPGRLAAFYLGQLPEDELEDLGAHLEHCPHCVAATAALAGLTDPVLDGVRAQDFPTLALSPGSTECVRPVDPL